MARTALCHLIPEVGRITGVRQADCAMVAEALVGELMRHIASGTTVEIPHFGVFTIIRLSTRVARNPRTNEEYTLPPHTVPRFKPSRLLRLAVRKVEAEG